MADNLEAKVLTVSYFFKFYIKRMTKKIKKKQSNSLTASNDFFAMSVVLSANAVRNENHKSHKREMMRMQFLFYPFQYGERIAT